MNSSASSRGERHKKSLTIAHTRDYYLHAVPNKAIMHNSNPSTTQPQKEVKRPAQRKATQQEMSSQAKSFCPALHGKTIQFH